jgi:hypothetical protein
MVLMVLFSLSFLKLTVLAQTPKFNTGSVMDPRFAKEPDFTGRTLLFADGRDVINTWGLMTFGITPLKKMYDIPDLGFTIKCCVPLKDGSWDVYGYNYDKGTVRLTANAKNPDAFWSISRTHTIDGLKYDKPVEVYKSPFGAWKHFCVILHNTDDGSLLALKSGRDKDGFSVHSFTSSDGQEWKDYKNNPVLLDGDSYGGLYSPILKKYVFFGKAMQLHENTINDFNIGQRRVLSLRTSEDGFHWIPDIPQIWHGERKGDYGPYIPDEYLITPDEMDPPDLQFYRGQGFSYKGRCYMMQLNYAPSPMEVNKFGEVTGFQGDKGRKGPKHVPQVDTEWWISRDGVQWERPFRGLGASKVLDEGQMNLISHNPMIIDGKILFIMGKSVWGVPEDRFTYVSSRTNSVFSTVLFTMQGNQLSLNAMVPSPDFPNNAKQAYIMAELIDDFGEVIPGYERDKCIVQENIDTLNYPLRWKGKIGKELAGKNVRIRFHMRASRIYAVKY